jgi:hypothetical protein
MENDRNLLWAIDVSTFPLPTIGFCFLAEHLIAAIPVEKKKKELWVAASVTPSDHKD